MRHCAPDDVEKFTSFFPDGSGHQMAAVEPSAQADYCFILASGSWLRAQPPRGGGARLLDKYRDFPKNLCNLCLRYSEV